jgi:hypothetical protein
MKPLPILEGEQETFAAVRAHALFVAAVVVVWFVSHDWKLRKFAQ